MKEFGFLLLIPIDSIIKVKDVLKDDDDVLIFRPDSFKEIFKELCKIHFDKCSVADVSVEADGSLGQG